MESRSAAGYRPKGGNGSQACASGRERLRGCPPIHPAPRSLRPAATAPIAIPSRSTAEHRPGRTPRPTPAESTWPTGRTPRPRTLARSADPERHREGPSKRSHQDRWKDRRTTLPAVCCMIAPCGTIGRRRGSSRLEWPSWPLQAPMRRERPWPRPQQRPCRRRAQRGTQRVAGQATRGAAAATVRTVRPRSCRRRSAADPTTARHRA